MRKATSPSRVLLEAQEAIKTLREGSWKDLFVIYIAFSLVSAMLLTPLVGITIQVLVSLSGQPALSDTEIATFLLSPVGAISGIIIATLVLTIAFLTYAALLVGSHAYYHHSHAHLTGIFRAITRRGPQLVKLCLRFTFAILLVALPIVGLIAADYLYFISDNDINYYLAEKPPEFIKAVVIAALLLISMGVLLIKMAISWFYALPLVLFASISSKSAKKRSTVISKGQKKHIGLWLALWLFGTPVAITLLCSPFNLVAEWLIPQLADRLPLLALTLGGTLAITSAISFIVGFITICMLAHQNLQMFEKCGLDTTVPVHFGAGEKFHVPLKEKYAFFATLAALTVCGIVCYQWISNHHKEDKVLIIAHRGSSMDAPENTLAAIQMAVDAGADFIEIDVQETADGVVVVFHDSDYKRLANKKLNIWDAQSSELPNIEIGSWFDPKFSDQTTPTLKQVFDICRGKSGVLIELKYYGHDVALEQKVIDIVEAEKMTEQIMIMSLNYEGMQKVRKLRPDWKIGLLSTVALGDITKLDVDFLGLNSRAATPKLVKRAHANSIEIFVWTVNTKLDISAMTSRGVDGLITDTPTT
ncbi:MAG: glycerophosphodiester phosphodiesterase family protein, partial [Rubritalea sp.]|uniref:glycerophosphodiester phosphodiesterase family protein n=1 Tax=Rubritalea sp. TaxID=2109375 RepID=UPI003242D64C